MKILCKYSRLVRVTELKENPLNPNRHDLKQITLFADVIRANGWRRPIVVSTRSGFITKGHGRLAAAIRLGLQEVPVEDQDYASETEEIADMVADNRIAELAEIDVSALESLIADTSGSEFRSMLDKLTLADEAPAEVVKNATVVDKGKLKGERGSIGLYSFATTIEECSKWVAELESKYGNNEAAKIQEVKRRLGL